MPAPGTQHVEPFRAARVRDGNVLVIRGSGRVEHANVTSFIEEMREAFETDAQRVVVNLGEVGFMTSLGWGTLLTGASNASKRGARVVLCGLAGPVRASYDLLSIQETLRAFDSEQDAVAG